MKLVSFAAYLALSFLSCVNQQESTGNDLQKDDEATTVKNETKDLDNTNGKLYLRTFQIGRSLEIDWIYLGDDGTIVYDPTDGVDPINYAAERINNADKVGKYKITGNLLFIDWDNGNKAKLPLEYRDGDINIIDGGIVTRKTGVPADFKLNGRYAGGAISKGMAVTHTYIFNADGSYILKRLGSVNTKTETTNNGTAKSEDELPGHYNITGNTLMLNQEDGNQQKAVIGIINLAGNRQYLVINQSSFRLEK